jgi:hypothetical protein
MLQELSPIVGEATPPLDEFEMGLLEGHSQQEVRRENLVTRSDFTPGSIEAMAGLGQTELADPVSATSLEELMDESPVSTGRQAAMGVDLSAVSGLTTPAGIKKDNSETTDEP